MQESVTLIYEDGGNALLDETTSFTPDAGATPAMRTAEEQARGFAGDSVILRFGYFYGADASHTQSQLRIARRGFLPLMGRPGAFQTYVHLDDAARAVVAALTVPPGTYNVTESKPGTVSEITAAMAAAVGRQRLVRLPIPRWSVGRANRFLFHSVRASNARFRAATTWEPQYPSPTEGWAQVAHAAMGAATS